jgi:MoaA/NifB/PqqE/SkfB family radical SAM enzyme
VRLLRERGVKVGLRFTMTAMNAHDLPALLDLMRDEGVRQVLFLAPELRRSRQHPPRQGRAVRGHARRRSTCCSSAPGQAALEGREEYVTGNNDADGVYLLQWVRERMPQWADALRARLRAWGGNSSGVNVANIDNLGTVHPDTMWWHHDLGNVRERPFSADLGRHLRSADGRAEGQAAAGGRALRRCHYFDICGGNTRVRAQQLTGDPWAEDPGCYLRDDEIGLAAGERARGRAPFSNRRRTRDRRSPRHA